MRRAGFNHGFRSSLLLKSWVASRQTSQVERTPAGRYEMSAYEPKAVVIDYPTLSTRAA